jgi:hypothetical protein
MQLLYSFAILAEPVCEAGLLAVDGVLCMPGVGWVAAYGDLLDNCVHSCCMPGLADQAAAAQALAGGQVA